jgi:hypothetical protein
MPRVTLSLIENSQCFFDEAVRRAVRAETSAWEWKFAILNMVQAVELSLKELLRRQHPLLIYSNIDSPQHTVTLEKALTRLRSTSSFELSKAEHSALKTAIEHRNAIVHYEFSAETEELKLAFAQLFAFMVEFHRVHLADCLRESC